MGRQIICENCENWKISQDVRREVPTPRTYYMYQDWMECKLGHKNVVDRNCTDWKIKIEGE